MRQTGLRMLSWLRREPVLCISAVCAALSMLLTPPSAAYLNYVDWRVISLLFCLMAVVAGLQDCGVFAVLAQRLLAGEKRLRFVTLVLVVQQVFTSLRGSKDVDRIKFGALCRQVMGLIGRTERLAYVVVLQTIAANLGSMATPVGNPQNLYLYATYELTPGQFFTAVLPLVLASLAGLTAAAVWGRPESIRVAFPQPVRVRRPGRLGLMCLLFVLCLLCVCRLLPYPALVAVVLSALVIFGRDLFRRLDYALLLTFVCFFLFAGNVGANPAVREVLTAVLARNTALASGIASQVISNVPAAVLLSGFTADWRGLLIGVNVGGLGTPIASLASLISLKAYLRSAGARPGRYLAVFLLANGIALAVLCACAWLLGRLQ